jgi:hypothetical protein
LARASTSSLGVNRPASCLRLFEHVASRLSEGKQPDIELLASVGYLMRTTAVYGSGKFGCADREKILQSFGNSRIFSGRIAHGLSFPLVHYRTG